MERGSIYLEDLRASCDGSQFGACLSKGDVTLWDANTLGVVGTFRPGFAGSNARYVIDSHEHRLYSAIWENGLTCYDFWTDRVLWKRRDLQSIQAVNLSGAFPLSLFVTLERPARTRGGLKPVFGIAELDRNTGETLWAEPNGQKAFVHPDAAILLICDGKTIRMLGADMQPIGHAAMVNFAILDAAFSGDRIALAEGAKGVRVIDVSGTTICSYSPRGRKTNCIEVAFHADRVCVHDSWEGAFVTTIDPVSGQVIAEHQRPIAGDICFIGDGSRYVDQTGAVFDALTGSQIGQLNPPETFRFKVGSWLRKCLKL